MNNWLLIGIAIALIGAFGGVGLYVYNISQSGINRIKRHEAFRAQMYYDQAGHPTIGWGHKIRANEQYLLTATITEAEGEVLLRADLAEAEQAVNSFVTVPLAQSQYDALVSLVFNIGVTAFRNSTLLKKLNAGDYAGAADEILRWNKITVPETGEKIVSDGLASRRADERNLFIA